MHWYRFPVSNYLAQTRGLADAEDLAYRRLIDLYWLREKPLDFDDLQRAVGLDLDCIMPVLTKFWIKTDQGWDHEELREQLRRRKAHRNALVSNGNKGGRPKKEVTPS